MDGNQLFGLYRNPQYVEAVERNLRESSELSELLERMNWLPRTLEEKEILESQTAKWRPLVQRSRSRAKICLPAIGLRVGEGRAANETVSPHAQQRNGPPLRTLEGLPGREDPG